LSDALQKIGQHMYDSSSAKAQEDKQQPEEKQEEKKEEKKVEEGEVVN